MAENGEINLKNIDYEAKDPTKMQDTKPTKYKNIKFKVLETE